MPLGLRPRGILSLLGTLYPIEHSRSLSNPYLVFKKKSRRVEDLETLFCEFSSFRPGRSFVKIIEFVRTLIGPFEPDLVITYLSFIVRDGRQSRRRSE